MSTDQTYLALLEAIRQDPQDDTVHLIAADRLDELGESARAELIRVQIELARLPVSKRSEKRRLITLSKMRIREPAKMQLLEDYGNAPLDYMCVTQPKIEGWLEPEQIHQLEGIFPSFKGTGQYLDGIGKLHTNYLVDLTDGRNMVVPACYFLEARTIHNSSLLQTVWQQTVDPEQFQCRQELEKRQRELACNYKPLWPPMGDTPFTNSTAFVLERGFVNSIHCTCQEFLNHAPLIYQQCPTLKSVRLTDKEPFVIPNSSASPLQFIWQCYPGDLYATKNSPDHLPELLYRYLSIEAVAGDNHCAYPSEQSAYDDLSRACLRYLISLKPSTTRSLP